MDIQAGAADPRRIVVIGAGAIGGLLGGLLAEGGHNVTLVDTWEDQVAALRRDGLRLVDDRGERAVRLAAASSVDGLGQADLVLVQVKTPATQAAARSARAIAGPDTVVLTLQNGLGNREVIREEVADRPVLAGVTYHSAALLAPGRIRHTAAGRTVVGGEGERGPAAAAAVVALLRAAGLDAEATDDLDRLLWSKLVVNATFNALCAISGLRSGELLRFPSSAALAREVTGEVVAVARALGHDLDEAAEHERIATICAGAGDALPSMAQDLARGSWTEIDAINGAVAREGERQGVPAPSNRLLARLVRVIEALHYGEERAEP